LKPQQHSQAFINGQVSGEEKGILSELCGNYAIRGGWSFHLFCNHLGR
jgi:hypothetical protein